MGSIARIQRRPVRGMPQIQGWRSLLSALCVVTWVVGATAATRDFGGENVVVELGPRDSEVLLEEKFIDSGLSMHSLGRLGDQDANGDAMAKASEMGTKLEKKASSWTAKANVHERKAKELESKAGMTNSKPKVKKAGTSSSKHER